MMKTNLGYKVPFRQCYTHRIFGKWGIIHYTLYCHVWLRLKNFCRVGRKLQIATLCVSGVALIYIVQGCANPPAPPQNTVISPVAQDLETAVQQATEAYLDAKNGDASFAWSVQKALDAYGLIVKTKADVKQVVTQWADDTKAGKTFAQKLADLFASYQGAPETKTAKMSRAVTKATRHYTVPKRGLTATEKKEIHDAAFNLANTIAAGEVNATTEEREKIKLIDRMRYRYRTDWRVVRPLIDEAWAEAKANRGP